MKPKSEQILCFEVHQIQFHEQKSSITCAKFVKLVYELIKAELFTEILGGKDVFIDQHLALNMILMNALI